MKTQFKLSFFVWAGVAVMAAGCKGKNDSSSAASSASDVVASSKGNSVMDSLSITDPDEKKVCALYDDAITDYMKELKTLSTDTSKAAAQKRADLDKEYRDKEKAIRPQIEAVRQKLVSNPMEESKFIQFSAYESKRLMSVMTDYTKGIMKNIPTSAPAGN
jgi:hypothetical protein